MSAQRGYPSQQKLERTPIQFVTVEPVHKEQNGASVVAHQFVFEVGTDTAEAGSTIGKIVATAHAALEGDVIRLTSGAQSGKEIKVVSVIANEINLAEDLPAPIAAGVTFQILRHKYPTVDSSGNVNVNAVINEVAVAADGGALPALTKVVSGYDGAAVQVLKTDANGELQIDVLSSALPAGAATEATLSTLATEATASAAAADISTIAGAVSGSEMQVDVVSSALPSGAATEATLANVATSANQTNGTQKSQIVDGAGDVADVVLLGTTLQATDKGLVTNTTIHGLTTGGGGGYVDVKVTPSGALVTDSTISGLDAAVLGQETMANSLPVVLASNQTAIPVTDNGSSLTVDGSVSVSNFPATQNVAVTSIVEVEVKNDSGAAIPVSVAALPLPSGAATESTLSSLNGKVTACNTGAVTISTALPAGTNNIGDVDVVSIVSPTGRSVVARARNVYSSTNVTTAAYTQLVASLGAAVNEVEIFDSSGETLVLATGGAGSEVDQAFVFPGGNGRIPLAIASGARVSIKAVSATANSGEIAINFYS